MEDIKNMLQKIQKNMEQQEIKMKNMEENITKSINNNINDKFKSLELKHSELEQQILTQEKRQDDLERNARRKNIVLFGLEETENSYRDLEQNVINFLNDKMKVSCAETEIDTVRRMGKKGDRASPIVVTFSTMGKRIDVLKNKKKLYGTPCYIKEDFPYNVLQKRKILKEELSKHLEQGQKAIIKYDKIVLLSNTYTNNKKHDTERKHGKRN